MAEVVEKAKVQLGRGVVLLGGFHVPFPSLDIILHNAVTEIVPSAKSVLGVGVTLLGLRAKLGYSVGCFLCGMERRERSQEKKE